MFLEEFHSAGVGGHSFFGFWKSGWGGWSALPEGKQTEARSWRLGSCRGLMVTDMNSEVWGRPMAYCLPNFPPSLARSSILKEPFTQERKEIDHPSIFKHSVCSLALESGFWLVKSIMEILFFYPMLGLDIDKWYNSIQWEARVYLLGIMQPSSPRKR
jgi:hypothetical protein